MRAVDAVVIGAGMAGASVAAHLAEHRRVVLVEAEERAGYHSTGRSAALFTEIYGNEAIRALTRASRAFLSTPPPGFTAGSLLRPRGCLFIATPAQLELLERFAALPDVAPATHPISREEAERRCPVLRPGYVAAALFEPDSADIDVQALHQGYLRLFRARGGELLTAAPVNGLDRVAGGWSVRAGGESLRTPLLVNAAGAWADEIAARAGVAPLGLTPMRRTALLIEPPPGIAVADWPFVNDIEELFYFKPEAGLLFISPADETPVAPGDAQPEEWDVAVAVERIENATTLHIERLKARWAGLRTFAPDRSPVVGFAPDAPGFFWLAGQGGYGIQTAPALSRLAAALALENPVPPDLLAGGLRIDLLAPGRPMRSLPAD
ncbi:MAG TPA: FAD-binding oxidoreductase [Steroidobacteraceae bacterium]|nr:FAD-binding oxidoreductase [Steroidobacteraceae bacterium]